MKLSKGFWQTYKETPADAEVVSHQLMLRAGLISKTAAGLFNLLPFGIRSHKKVEQIIREELDRVGCYELLMTMVTPGDLWKESGRWEVMGPEMLKLKDRGERDLCLSPTNEEAIVDIFRKTIKSYKQLPVTLYQINTKFRDEIRPRYGVMRSREFVMKDAYSFHASAECLRETYEKLFSAYENIFKKLGLKFIAVEADGGNMADGDAKTHEFQVLANSGEDAVIRCKKCGYAANIEKAKTKRTSLSFSKQNNEIKLVDTPNSTTIEEVSSYLDKDKYECLKSIVYASMKGKDEEFVLVLTLGDDELNEVKLSSYLGCDHVRPATDNELKYMGMPKGYIGPYGLKAKVNIIYDENVDLNGNYVTGGLVEDKHYVDFIPASYKHVYNVADMRLSREGDLCSVCEGDVEEIRGIEVGHIFELGDKYTKSMNVTVLDKLGKTINPLMGCYGIGVGRTVAASIEQGYDDKGIIWPVQIAPYHVHFIVISKDKDILELSYDLYDKLNESKIETIIDDRKVGPGFKFKDADLLGLPLVVVLGERDYKKDGMIEIRYRKSGKIKKAKKENLVDVVKDSLEDLIGE